jgi:Lamin Tail Domain
MAAAPVVAPVVAPTAPVAPVAAPVVPTAPVAAPVAAPPTSAPAAPPTGPKYDVIINEIMFNPTGQDSDQEWIELYNAGNLTVNLQNWSIGNSFAGRQTINATVFLNVSGYVVLGMSTNKVANGNVTVDYAYGNDNIFWSNNITAGDTVLLFEPSGTVHDTVQYGTWNGYPSIAAALPSPPSKSIALNRTNLDNSLGRNWCVSGTVWPGSTNGDKGSPGAVNVCT